MWKRLLPVGLALAVAIAGLGVTGWCADQQGDDALLPNKMPSKGLSGTTPQQAARAAARPAPLGEEKLASNPEVSRGPGAGVYAKVAPATVLIHTGNAYGSGFLVSDDGWMLTNHHVAVEGGLGKGTGVRVVAVYLGKMEGRVMEVQQPAILGVVFKTSPEKDLALVKLSKMPPGVERLPFVELSEEVAVPGSDCVALGHPRAGMMWTVRSGELSAVGTWPQDMIQTVVARLAASPLERAFMKQALRSAPKRKVLISTCGINPGDSGGPLVDEHGKLIGVTFAIPRSQQNEGISVDKFSYHLHLDEVRAFLADRPERPEPFIPDPWPQGTVSILKDRTRDKILDTLVFAMGPDKPPTGCLVDLDQDTTPDFDAARLAEPAMRKAWDYEFALHIGPAPRALYDTDNDGRIDVILTDFSGDDQADLALLLNDGKWEAKKTTRPLFDPSLFEDEKARAALAKIVGSGASSSAPPPPPVVPSSPPPPPSTQ